MWSQQNILNSDSEKAMYLLRYKFCREASNDGKKYQISQRGLERVTGKFLKNFSPLTNYLDDNSEIEDGDFIFLNNVKYFNSLKKEKSLGNIDLKPSARQV